jgi:hypothetical protein
VKHQPKWRAKSTGSSITDLWVSSSDQTAEEEVSRSMGWDREIRRQRGRGMGRERGRKAKAVKVSLTPQ